jgi:hypothetical protein
MQDKAAFYVNAVFSLPKNDLSAIPENNTRITLHFLVHRTAAPKPNKAT